MMRTLVLSSGTGWHVQDLLRAAALTGDPLTVASWRGVGVAIDRNTPRVFAGELDAGAFDAVLLRTLPPASLEQIVLQMDAMHELVAQERVVVNHPSAIEISVDKARTLALVARAGIAVPDTVACQRFDEAVAHFERLGGDAVMKPLFGSEGFGITRLADKDLASRAFEMLQRGSAIVYLQRFVDHGGADTRLFVMGNRVLAAMRRTNPGDWRTNVARGGVGEAITPEPALVDIALRAARACHAELAGVDVAVPRGGAPLVLEVNAIPGWRELSRVTGIDVAAEVLRYVAGKR